MPTQKRSPLSAKMTAVGFLGIVAACAAIVVSLSDVPTLPETAENILAVVATAIAAGCIGYLVAGLRDKMKR